MSVSAYGDSVCGYSTSYTIYTYIHLLNISHFNWTTYIYMKEEASFAVLSCQMTSDLCFPPPQLTQLASFCYRYVNQTGTYQAALLPTRNMALLETAGKLCSLLNSLFRHGSIHLSRWYTFACMLWQLVN